VNLNLVCIGRKMPGWVEQGWQDYQRRLPPHLPLKLIAMDSSRGGNAKEIQQAEAELLRKRMPQPARVVALDGAGQRWNTEQLAKQLEAWQMDGRAVNFLIGGADGLDASLLAEVDQHWSLGPLTLPHMLVRVILAEQLYRAWSLTQGHPYHRA